MKRTERVMAYITPPQKLRLEILALASNATMSDWIAEKVDSTYRAVFGDEPPDKLLPRIADMGFRSKKRPRRQITIEV